MLFDKFSPATRGAILLVCGTGSIPFSGLAKCDRMFWLWMFIIAVLASTALSLMTRAYQLAQTRYAEMFE